MTISISNFACIRTFGFGVNTAVTPSFNTESLFKTVTKQGVIYDPSDLTTLWQDAAGTVPVTKSGDPVGLMLDKSRGNGFSENFVVNGTFDTNTTAWTASSAFVSARIVDGKMYVDHTDVGYMYQAVPTTIGQKYLLTGSFVKSGNGRFFMGTAIGDSIYYFATATTNINVYFTATTTTTYISIGSVALNTATQIVDDMVIRAVYGNPASQTLSASRPVYQTDGTKSWLYNDKVDDSLLVTLPAMTATVVTATDDGVTINYPVSIAAGSRDITSTSTLGRDYGRLIIDRELTAAEKTEITAYFNTKRGV